MSSSVSPSISPSASISPSVSISPSASTSPSPELCLFTIKSFTGIVTKHGYEGEATVFGEDFTYGGIPVLYIDNVVVPINSYSDTFIKFYMPRGIEIGYHTLKILVL